MIRRGDKVKLIARKRPSKLTARRGVVERITANKANAVVLWDGRMSREYVPIAAIEFAASLSTGDSHRPSRRRIPASADQSH